MLLPEGILKKDPIQQPLLQNRITEPLNRTEKGTDGAISLRGLFLFCVFLGGFPETVFLNAAHGHPHAKSPGRMDLDFRLDDLGTYLALAEGPDGWCSLQVSRTGLVKEGP